MKCINCGAELHGRKCEYCGSEYADVTTIRATFDGENPLGKLTVGNDTYDVYLSVVEYERISPSNYGRDINGKVINQPTMIKRRFKLVER